MVVCQVITWLRHVTCRNGSVRFWYVLPPGLVIAALVIVAYDVFDLSPEHVIKIHAIGRLGTISSFPQNLAHICFPVWNFGRKYKTLLLQNKTVITKWNRKQLSTTEDCYYKMCHVLESVTGCYCKVRQVSQIVAVITKWDVTDVNPL